tara:strand:+ start:14317 stop:16500 length:2184 start_codon:yes stop_codon:yes gene_type:complete
MGLRMPKTALERNSFVKGLFTEATPLTFPENASIDENNFTLNRDGSRQRRLGMAYEPDYALIDTLKTSLAFNSVAITSFKWENVADNAALTVGVVQVGNILHLLDLSASAPSATVLDTVTLPTRYSNTPITYAPIKGVLVMASSGDTDGPQYLQRDSASSYAVYSYILSVRDIWGVEDTLDVDERPSVLTDVHAYNLLNQGWTETNYDLVAYPSNSDVMQYGKNATDDFSKAFMEKQFFGNTPAPKGKYIINAYTRGASRAALSGLTVLTDRERGAATAVATYAGRIFYAGISSDVTDGDAKSPSYSGTILFTSLIDNVSKLGLCYQEADPTSEHVSDLIATDGGSIDIPEATNIYRLITTGTSLVVLAENGVWEITGPDGVFKADDFSISQITNTGIIGANTAINVEGSIIYWSEGGIYVLTPDKVSGKLTAQNLTESTIQTFYNNITSIGKLYAKGNYDAASRKVSWLYNDSVSYNGSGQNNYYIKELVFDTVLQAFYPNTIQEQTTDSPFIAGYMSTTSFLTVPKLDEVVVNGVPVLANGVQVVVTSAVRGTGLGTTKYITIKPDTSYSLTLSYYWNADFLDWGTEDAPAYLIAGYETFADSQRRKWVDYITTHFRRTETGFTDDGTGNLTPISPSSCLIQAQWDFANSANSGKWGTQFQAYRLTRSYMPSGDTDTFDYGHVMITTKNRLRGSGKALSLRFDTEAAKDCHIYGWAMVASGNENV